MHRQFVDHEHSGGARRIGGDRDRDRKLFDCGVAVDPAPGIRVLLLFAGLFLHGVSSGVQKAISRARDLRLVAIPKALRVALCQALFYVHSCTQ
eukprot:679217-Prorocentrum_minimum.AAC.6